MQDQQDEDKRHRSVTTRLPDMHASVTNEDGSPADGQVERKSSTDAHPKKKRKVNHGQELSL